MVFWPFILIFLTLKIKRLFDFILSLLLTVLLSPAFVVFYILSSFDTESNGLFFQKRVGQYGKLFTIYKLKTIHPKTQNISKIGRFFRKSKIDELPQLFNILNGTMSFVGYRPDIEGYYDTLQGEKCKILNLKPGLTSLASLKYANEEYILAQQKNPLKYNDEIIFPDKVKMNLEYTLNHSFLVDLQIILKTLKSIL